MEPGLSAAPVAFTYSKRHELRRGHARKREEVKTDNPLVLGDVRM